jgi:hypothetical protein
VISGVIDPARGFAYYSVNSTNDSPMMILKVRLSDFTIFGTLTLNPDETYTTFDTTCYPPPPPPWLPQGRYCGRPVLDPGAPPAVIDPGAGVAYFAADTHFVKIRLSDMTRVGALASVRPITSAYIDPNAGFAAFGNSRENWVVSLSDFKAVDWSNLPIGYPAAVDFVRGFTYVGAFLNTTTILKLNDHDFAAFGIVPRLPLGGIHFPLLTAVIDTAGGFAYFGSGCPITIPPTPQYCGKTTIVKIRLLDLTMVGSLTLNVTEPFIRSAVVDPGNGFAYFASGAPGSSGMIQRIRLSNLTLAETLTPDATDSGYYLTGVIDPNQGFAYFGQGHTIRKFQIVNLPITPIAFATLGLFIAIIASTTVATLVRIFKLGRFGDNGTSGPAKG